MCFFLLTIPTFLKDFQLNYTLYMCMTILYQLMEPLTQELLLRQEVYLFQAFFLIIRAITLPQKKQHGLKQVHSILRLDPINCWDNLHPGQYAPKYFAPCLKCTTQINMLQSYKQHRDNLLLCQVQSALNYFMRQGQYEPAPICSQQFNPLFVFISILFCTEANCYLANAALDPKMLSHILLSTDIAFERYCACPRKFFQHLGKYYEKCKYYKDWI